MTDFETKSLSAQPDVTAPDGSDVRILLSLSGGSMAHFELAPGKVTVAVAHKSVEEIWYILAGKGQMWRASAVGEEVTDLVPGLSLTIPLGTRFQFRASGDAPLQAVAITMPPWPGDGEAASVEGKWPVNLA